MNLRKMQVLKCEKLQESNIKIWTPEKIARSSLKFEQVGLLLKELIFDFCLP